MSALDSRVNHLHFWADHSANQTLEDGIMGTSQYQHARLMLQKGSSMRYLIAVLLIVTSATSTLAAGRAMTIDDLLAVKSVSDPQVSPDGKLMATASFDKTVKIWNAP